MPSSISHLLLLDQTVAESATLRSLVSGHETHAAWGSVGPDFLFFHPKDWSGFGPVMEFIFRVQNELREVVRVYKEIENFTGDVQDFLTGGLYSQLKSTADYLQVTIHTSIAAAVSTRSDLFLLFESPQQRYEPVTDWWWMDIAHSYRSGRYLDYLWTRAGTDPKARAYAAGYSTHVAGDVVGHPFVNIVSGGPYRLHARRHVLIEKAFDTHLLQKHAGLNISDCGWHERLDFSEGTDPYPELPDDLASVIQSALNDSYSNMNIRTGIPSVDELKMMYRFYYMWMKGVTGEGVLNLGPPPNFRITDLPQDIQNILSQPQPTIPVTLPQTENDWRRLILALFAFLDYCLQVLTAIAALSYFIIMQLTTAGLRYVLWIIQRLLFEIYRKARLVLSLGAYLHPATEDLDYFTSVTTGLVRYFEWPAPWIRYRNAEQTYHLIHPSQAAGAQLETPAVPIFSLYNGPLIGPSGAYSFDDASGPLFGSAPTGPFHDHLAICTLADMNAVSNYVAQGLGFVAASRLGDRIVTHLVRGRGALPNWNLDGDRGISWPAWTALSPRPWSSSADFQFEC